MKYVLIINGDPQQQEEIADALSNRGIACRVAGSEQEAVLSLQDELPALIVWDWPAQDIPAEIFLAVLRQEGFCGSILVCTASLEVEDIPFDLLLQKPFDLDLLSRTIGRMLIEVASLTRQARLCELTGA
ncbi:MAG: hypothetical protein AB7G38_09155 [Dehalococcoidia bacterium]